MSFDIITREGNAVKMRGILRVARRPGERPRRQLELVIVASEAENSTATA